VRIISLCDTFFLDLPGGLARVAWDVAKALARRGHEVAMVAGAAETPAVAGACVVEERIDGVRVFRYPKPTPSRLDPFRASKQIRIASRALAAVMATQDWEVIHCHSIYTAAAALIAAPLFPRLQTVHSPAIQELPYNWSQQGVVGHLTALGGRPMVRRLEIRAVSTAARCHALSRFTVNEMTGEYPGVRQNYTVIPHWVDPGWFRLMSKEQARSRLGWPSAIPVLFTVRQLRHRYGIDTAIRAVAPLARAGLCQFYIGGSGEDATALERLIASLGVSGSVRLLGRLSDEDLRLAYQAADLFVLPTRALECFGLIILEAMACGLPVVGTRVGAIPENLMPILPNCIVPPDDPQALEVRIKQFLDRQLEVPAGEELAAYVAGEFGESKVVDAYESLLTQVVGG
jgi:glycosyltransferase involved in cell wall biosynthesis